MAQGLGAAGVGFEIQKLVVGVKGFRLFAEPGGDGAEQIKGFRVVMKELDGVFEAIVSGYIVAAVGVELRHFDVFGFALVVTLQMGGLRQFTADRVAGG